MDFLSNMFAVGDSVTVTYFSLQKRIGDYEVGNYVTETACVEEIDLLNQALVLPHAFVPFTDIYDLQGEGFDYEDGEPTETICGSACDPSD